MSEPVEPRRVALYGHRGAPKERPENTLPSFARALELGADALETDVHMTRDGHVVVSHDPGGERAANVAARIRECTLAEVRGWDAGWGFLDARGGRPFAGRGVTVPTLEEALVEFPGVDFSVDVKQRSPSMVPAVLALVRRLRAQPRVLLASFQSATLRAIRRAGYEGPTGLGRSEVVRLALLPGMLQAALAPPAGWAAQVPLRAGGIPLATPGFVDRCHALGLRVQFWTVNDPARARALIELGADAVMTDDPAAIAPVFAALRASRTIA